MFDASRNGSPEAPCNGQSILKYLRRMARYARDCNHREMTWYYHSGWEFAAGIIYGKLPPLGDHSTGQHPETVRTQFPQGAARPPEPWPLKTVIKRFTLPWNNAEYTYETLECYHIISGPVGWYAPVKRRRCIHCALAAAQPKKKSAASTVAVAIAKAKAVGA